MHDVVLMGSGPTGLMLAGELRLVVRGIAGEELLDTYHAERHPAGARALQYTMAQSLFQKAEPRQETLRDLLDECSASTVRECLSRRWSPDWTWLTGRTAATRCPNILFSVGASFSNTA